MATDATYALRTSSDDTHTADDQMPSPTYRSLQTKYSSKMAAAGLGQAESRCPAADAFEHRTSGSLHSPGESPGASGSSGFSSSLLDQAPEEAISAMFDQRVTLLVSTLDTLRTKCEVLTEQAAESSSLCSSYATRLARSEEAVRRLQAESEAAQERERQLRLEVSRLETLLEAGRLQASFTEARLQQSLAEERVRGERMRLLRDDALQQRDNALHELSGCYADVDALQATLADSALYVRYLRKRLLELELAAARQQQQQEHTQHQRGQGGRHGEGPDGGGGGDGGGLFSLASIRQAIHAAVAEAERAGEEERKKLVRQLQLRWHPDKNPVLKEFATEVTKIINEAVADMERRAGR